MSIVYRSGWSYNSPEKGTRAPADNYISSCAGNAGLKEPFSARRRVTGPQLSALTVAAAIGVLLIWLFPAFLMTAGYWLLWSLFMGNAVLRLWACTVRAKPTVMPDINNEALPDFTVVVALFREAEIVPQLFHNLKQIDYPSDRIEFLFALEQIDSETQAAFERLDMPANFRAIVVPEGYPRTKPRALNHALKLAKGDLLVIYDAEDQPHPLQLREAAQAFRNAPAELACVQAPLRPKGVTTFIGKHFSVEYAVHFDMFLPALFKAGISFPLGGTSNHFRTRTLRELGGWDEYNVTEDADLGLRLAAEGYKSGLLRLPTIETPPADSRTWIPQRTRWIKGYLQTLLVHTRFNRRISGPAMLALFLGIGLSLLCAFANAPFTLMTIAFFALNIIQLFGNPDLPLAPVHLQDAALFFTGWLSALLCLWVGARRAGIKLKMADLASAPLYWMLHTVAACYALSQLFLKPHHWDKTEHSLTVGSPVLPYDATEVAT